MGDSTRQIPKPGTSPDYPEVSGASSDQTDYRAILDAIDEGFCTLQLLFAADGKVTDYEFLEVNAAFEAQTGLKDVVGKRMRDLVPAHEQAWFEIYGRVATTRQPERFEQRAEALGHWYDVYAFPVGAPSDGRLGTLFHDISARKGQEQALWESRQRYQALVSAGAYSIYRMSADWQFMFQLDSDTLVETLAPFDTWMERYIPPQARSMVVEAIDHAIRTKSLFELEHQVLLADGGTGWVFSRAVPMLDNTGRITQWFGVATDITARRADAERRREIEDRLRQFGEAAQDVLWLRDAGNLQWVYLTPAFETIYGMSRVEALEGDNFRSWLDLIMPEDRAHAAAMIDRVRAGEKTVFEYRIQRPSDGEIRWLRNTDFPITDADGRIALIGGIGHEVTEEKRVQQALMTSEERLSSAVRVGKLGLWDWNMAADQVHWSDEHFHLLGYATGEVRPSYAHWLNRVHPDDRAATEAALQEALRTHSDFIHEFRSIHPDGSVHWLAGRGRFFYENDTPTRMVGAMRDITERREWEERQRVLVAELQHRTRNLIGVVQAMADKTAAASEDINDFTHLFRERLDALARTQGLLSRLHEHDRVTFDELINTEFSAMDGTAHQIVLSGPLGVRLRSSTVQTLAMAIHELATNAVKYGALSQPQGRLSVTWRLGARDTDAPWLNIEWQESGVLMPPEGSRPQGTGQGRELIERALPYQFDAETSYELGADGVRCTIGIAVSTKGQ